MFYDVFKALCDERGVTPNRATIEMGLSNSTATKWKNKKATPDSTTLSKVAAYFGVPIGWLLEDQRVLWERMGKAYFRARGSYLSHGMAVYPSDIAKAVGITVDDLKDFEFDGKPVPLDVLREMCKYVGTTVSALISRTESLIKDKPTPVSESGHSADSDEIILTDWEKNLIRRYRMASQERRDSVDLLTGLK